MRPSPYAADAAAGRTAPANAPGSRPVTRRLLFSWIFAGIVVLGYMPYAGAGRHVLGGLRNYAAVWEANDSIFRLVRLSGNSQAQAELVIAIMLLGLLAYVLREPPRLVSQPCPRQAFHSAPPDSPSRIGDPRLYLLRSALILLAGLVLLSPDAFPWYFTWSIPFLCFWPSAPWLLLSVTAVLGYAPVVAYAAGQPYVHSPFMLALEYGPVMLWLAWIGTQRLLAHTIEGRARFF